MTEVKTRKPKTERYEVDGSVVELIKMTPDQYRGYHGLLTPAVRSQWEVKVDGVLRGYVTYPLGVGRWRAYSLLPREVRPYGFEWGKEPAHIYRAWVDGPDHPELEGGWSSYSGRFGGLTMLSPGTENSGGGWQTRQAVARAWPAIIARGEAPDAARVEECIEECREIAIEHARVKLENEARYAREDAERKAAAAQKAEEAETARKEILEGLLSIRDRLAGHLTNHEADAICRAIERYVR